jgi:hypothetical protein
MARRRLFLCALALAAGIPAGRGAGAQEMPRERLNRECDQGYVYSCAGLGLRHRYGRHAKLDYAQSYVYFRRACDGGLIFACGYAGEMQLKGLGATYAPEKGLKQLTKACELGDGWSCATLRRHEMDEARAAPPLRE